MIDILRYLLLTLLCLIVGVKACYGQSSAFEHGKLPKEIKPLVGLLQEEEWQKVMEEGDKLIMRSTDSKVRALANWYKGQAQSELLDLTNALMSFQSAIDEFSKIKASDGLAWSYYKVGDINFLLNNYGEADAAFRLALTHGQKARLTKLIRDIYQKRASTASAQRQNNNAIAFLLQALQRKPKQTDSTQLVHIINELSTLYHAEGKLDSAIYYFQQLRALKELLQDEEGLISDYCSLGKLYGERGDYNLAQANLINALRLAEAQADSFSMEAIYLDIGDLYAKQSLWTNAEAYYQSALSIAQSQQSLFTLANSYEKLADVSNQNKDFPSAITNYERALTAYRKLNNRSKISQVLIRLSQLYNENDHYEEAKALLTDALNARSGSEDVFGRLSLQMSLAELEITHGSASLGIRYAKASLEEFRKMEDREGQLRVYALLRQAYAKRKNYQEAYRYQMAYSQISDSLTSVEKAEAIRAYDVLYNTEKKDKEIALKNEKIKTQEVAILSKNNQLLILGGGLLLVGLLSAFFIFINWKNRQLNQQKIAMIEKEKEAGRLKAIIEGEEKERKRFSRELHDGLGAVLATVKMQISVLPKKIPEASNLFAYHKAESLIDEACKTVREISHDLMPQVLEQQGLIFAIEDMCQTIASRKAIEFDFIHFGEEEGLEDVVKVTLYRIIQELLKNCIKHAEATAVIVQLTIEPEEVILIVEDNGKGFNTQVTAKGIGLENIRSRVAYLEGALDIDSRTGEGTTFTIQIPGI